MPPLYVIVRNDGKYVAASGSESSYTNKLELAQTYETKADALKNCCVENESVVPLLSLLTR